MKILLAIKFFDNNFLSIQHSIQKISLTIFLECFIFHHLVDESISCYNRSRGTIANTSNQAKRDLLNKAIHGVIKRISKANSLNQRPAIFRRITVNTIINDSGMSIRTKSLTQNICSGMRYSYKCFLIFVTTDNIHASFNGFVCGKSTRILIHSSYSSNHLFP